MKMRQTNANISDLKDSIENSIKNARDNAPISLYGEIIEDMKIHNNNWIKGKKKTEEHKKKISSSRMGIKPNEETRKKLSYYAKNRKWSDEHKKRISETMKIRRREKNAMAKA